jgi:seryl-tRNA synthetase
MPGQVPQPSPDQAAFLQELVDHGLLFESGVAGVYGHSETFERIRGRIEALVSSMAAAEEAVSLRFPPVIPRYNLESTGYVGKFPQLTGSIFCFDGSEPDARAQRERAHAHEDWSEFQAQTDLMLLPAACYPVYPVVAAQGPLPPGGAFLDIGAAWVFRHEPSHDPARRQIFRMHELVRIGDADTVATWRSVWAQRAVELLRGLGLDARIEGASDPFFGREGRLLATSQRDDDLKWELLVPIAGPEPTACASFNCHLDHFGETWDLRLADGGTAHTACVGFGQERIVAALLRKHGLDPERWPTGVRARLEAAPANGAGANAGADATAAAW